MEQATQQLNIKQFCQLFYQATYIPLTYFTTSNTHFESFPNFFEEIGIYTHLSQKIHFNQKKRYYITDSFAFFGYIPILNSNEYIIVGPIFNTRFTANHIGNFMKEFHLDTSEKETASYLLQNTPVFSLNQCLNILSFLEFTLNKQTTTLESKFNRPEIIQNNMGKHFSQLVSEQREEEFIHNSYYFEKSLNHALSIGSRPLLQKILSEAGKIKTGKIANNTLRQQKNIFIATITLATRAAIDGGLAIEDAYSLSDLYIQECEYLETIDEILILANTMYIDFTDRVSKANHRQHYSPEVFKAIQFIHNNINTVIQVKDAANATGYSYSYLKQIFKHETGLTLSQFIAKTKIDVAKELLTYSNHSISYISNYLCFSSQSYFQNQFKKLTGLTPLQYRKANRVV
ncbi:helix-turn-helix domain-containing protein [Aerococcaceae bacterium zg-B36]|uniref:helix-turn-helix domain-containing protein n=1 Tax=Aerococcaceae bacterium zg-252 TaxID=2796928 RepID=UPI001BD8B6F9|nr:helix-turn-helix domain-containing protein [Aerococcaceae bacterium zg-B36]